MDINEVYPNIFISDETTARSKGYLQSIGITHVVNAAEGHLMGFVNTSSQFYQGSGITYKGINLADLSMADASKYFKEVANFIDNALNSGGKVLVHCLMGISRSGTMVLAFLMLKRGMTAVEAMTTVRRKRNIHPNDGFIHQLAKLDNKLQRKRKSASPDPTSSAAR
ncbi:phosphatase [Nesidiocoris tenuis]|uniref:Dual specificity protein phosphatase n=1 Tax=Nesidiocoris tenuis TaxID=355587 RepID=A0ABN7AGX0_9HEMI|nr:phosphatase [Nesidiocoris tenuis]